MSNKLLEFQKYHSGKNLLLKIAIAMMPDPSKMG
jgi:hypothetical protein